MTITNFAFDPSAQYLFGRSYSVAIGAPGQTSARLYTTQGANPSPVRIKFDIDKNSLGTSNKAKIEIYNLSQQSRQAIKKGYVVRLQAGYKSLLRVIFVGNVLPGGSNSNRVGTDIITTLECGDGESSIVMARLDKTYPAGVRMATILQDVATAMGTPTSYNPVGVYAGVALGIPNVIFNNGFVAHGECSVTLDKLLKSRGMEWHVQNGNLNIIPVKGYNGRTAIVVSAQTGMTGVPSMNDQVLKFDNLLNGDLLPGQAIQMVSQNTTLNGFYKLRRSHFEGDSHDQKWGVACEAIALPGAVQVLPTASGFDYNGAVIA